MATEETWEIIRLVGVEQSTEIQTLTITTDNCIIFSSRPEQTIHYNDLRWINKKPFLVFCDEQKSTPIILSYTDVQTQIVEYEVFEVVVSEEKDKKSSTTDDCFNKLHSLIVLKLEMSQYATGHVDSIVRVIDNQPIFVNKVDALVNFDHMPEDWEGQYSKVLVILDLECLCVFVGPSDKHHIFFWTIEDPKSVDMVKSLANRYISIKTQTMEYRFKHSGDGFADVIKKLTPTQKHLFTDIKAMAERFKEGATVGYVAPTPAWPRAESSKVWEFAPTEKYKPKKPIRRNTDMGTGDSYGATFIDVNNTIDDSYGATFIDENNTKADALKFELDDAIETFKDEEDIQNYWITMEYDIRDIIDSGHVPLTDYQSGGLDPNSAEHLEKCFQDIQDHIKENNFPTAISRLRACKDLFRSSKHRYILKLVDMDELYILKALYMKTLRS